MIAKNSTTTTRAESPAVVAKAAQLVAVYEGDGHFLVESGSKPGKIYIVSMAWWAAHPTTWACGCAFAQHGGSMCSHVRAAVIAAERICEARGIRPAWAPAPMPALPAPKPEPVADALPVLPETVECPKCWGRGGECERCQGEGEVAPWCYNCELPSSFDPPLAAVRVRDWQAREYDVCADCLAYIEADPDGCGNAVVVATAVAF